MNMLLKPRIVFNLKSTSLKPPNPNPQSLVYSASKSHLQLLHHSSSPSPSPSPVPAARRRNIARVLPAHSAKESRISEPIYLQEQKPDNSGDFSRDAERENSSRLTMAAAVSLGVAVLFLIGFDDQKALALGPEGPLMEEFWDNMRRYAIYVLTVSTGALYTVFQPIYELLKNPISAILVLVIAGGSLYIVSQVLSAMVGVSDFSYDYNY